MLRRWGLEPLSLDQLPSEGQTVIEKLERYITEDVAFAVVLATPDDEGHRKGHRTKKLTGLGKTWFLRWACCSPSLGDAESHLTQTNRQNGATLGHTGLIYIPFKDDLQKEAGLLLAKEMAGQGFNIEIKKL